MDSQKGSKSGHHEDSSDSCPHDANDCCGQNCPNKDCCLHLNVYQPLTFQTLSIEFDSFQYDMVSVEKNDFYKFFHYKELIYSVWQPPKLLS